MNTNIRKGTIDTADVLIKGGKITAYGRGEVA